MNNLMDFSEFILEFIYEVDYNDLDTLLKSIFSKKVRKQINRNNGNLKAEFLIYLTHHFKETELLFLHLNAIYECYNSYQCYFIYRENAKEFSDAYKNYFNEEIKINYITEMDLVKIFGMIINCYSEYKFYYSFSNDKLIKKAIIVKTDGDYKDYNYDTTSYQLIRKKDNTIVINEEKQLHVVIEKELPIMNSKINCSEKESFKKNLRYLSFQDIKFFHKNFIELMKNTKKTCAWCCPEPNNNKQKQLCSNCRCIEDEFKRLKKYLSTFFDKNGKSDLTLNNYLCDIYSECTLDTLVKTVEYCSVDKIDEIKVLRAKKLNQIFNKIRKVIRNDLNDFKDSDKYKRYKKVYSEIINIVDDIQILIEKSFKN